VSYEELRLNSQPLLEDAQLYLLIVNAFRLNNEFDDLIREGYSQDSFYADEGKWSKDNQTNAKAWHFWRLGRLCVIASHETLSSD
jgi:hypothetical protein